MNNMEIDVVQDWDGSFEAKIVKKRQRDIYCTDDKIISMYLKWLTTHQILEQIDDIYCFEASEGIVSDNTDRLLMLFLE